MENKPNWVVEVPNAFLQMLQESTNVRLIDHKIKLVLRVKPPAQVSYRKTPPELVELRKQLIS